MGLERYPVGVMIRSRGCFELPHNRRIELEEVTGHGYTDSQAVNYLILNGKKRRIGFVSANEKYGLLLANDSEFRQVVVKPDGLVEIVSVGSVYKVKERVIRSAMEAVGKSWKDGDLLLELRLSLGFDYDVDGNVYPKSGSDAIPLVRNPNMMAGVRLEDLGIRIDVVDYTDGFYDDDGMIAQIGLRGEKAIFQRRGTNPVQIGVRQDDIRIGKMISEVAGPPTNKEDAFVLAMEMIDLERTMYTPWLGRVVQ